MAQGEQQFRPRRCCWQMLEMIYVGDNFEILVTDLRCRWPSFYIKKVTNLKVNVINIMILPEKS